MSSSKERAAFTLSGAIKLKLENAIPKSKRSQFVEKAIADALLVEAKIEALKALDEPSGFNINGRDSVELLQRIRQTRDDELSSRQQA